MSDYFVSETELEILNGFAKISKAWDSIVNGIQYVDHCRLVLEIDGDTRYESFEEGIAITRLLNKENN